MRHIVGRNKMEHAYFPMFVDISDWNVLVVGGGTIAARRVGTLRHFTEHITVLSPKLCESMELLHQSGVIRWLRGEYTPELLENRDLVLAATDRPEINRKIVEDCREKNDAAGKKQQNRRILVNTADDKELCDFYFPSVVQTDNVTVGISSGGTNPGKVKEVRRQIENLLEVSGTYIP